MASWLSLLTAVILLVQSALDHISAINLSTNRLQGTLPCEWSALTSIRRMVASENAELSGSLPSQWSTWENLGAMAFTVGGLTGTLPKEWSALSELRWLWMGQQRLTGTLPREWSALSNLQRLFLGSNLLTGTIPPEWATILFMALNTKDNWLTGTLPPWLEAIVPPEDSHSQDDLELDLRMNLIVRAPETLANKSLIVERNCLPNSRLQNLCPPAWWKWAIGWSMFLVFGACVALWAALQSRRPPHGLGGRSRLLRAGYSGLRPLQLLRSTFVTKVLLLAVIGALTQRLFVLSPLFTDTLLISVVDLVRRSGTMAGVLVRMVARNLFSFFPLAPIAIVLVAFLLRLFRLLVLRPEWLPGSAAARAWTLVASEDVLRDNLWAVQVYQLVLLAVFGVASVLLPLAVYVSMPATFTMRRVDPVEPLASIADIVIQMPRTSVTLQVSSSVYAFYSMVVAVTIPEAMLCPSTAIREAVRARRTRQRSGVYLRRLHWLRWAMVHACISATLFVISALWSTMHFAPWGTANPNVDADEDKPALWGENVLPILVGLQMVLAVAWNLALWGEDLARGFQRCRGSKVLRGPAPAPAYPGDHQPPPAGNFFTFWPPKRDLLAKLGCSIAPSSESLAAVPAPAWAASPDGPATCASQETPRTYSGPSQGSILHRILQPQVGVIGRSRARLTAVILAIALLMVHINGGGTLSKVLTWAACLASALILAWAAVVRDRPVGFEDIYNSEAFGMVVLASDLAAALEADLASYDNDDAADNGDDITSLEPPSCCSNHPAGCPQCQQLLRRFPATLFRMEETMCVSYRWQEEVRAVVRPRGHSPVARCSGVLNQVVGINMSRWQREELLAGIKHSSCTYVWLDVLSIPAALEPEPGTKLWDVSEKLMTRMMAVYASAASTLVLLSKEEEGSRYCQRAWTLQEYCGARAVRVVSQSSSRARSTTTSGAIRNSVMSRLSGFRLSRVQVALSARPEEAERYRELRGIVSKAMVNAVPFWIMKLTGRMGNAELMAEQSALFASVVDKVNCTDPIDEVRALVPLLLNASVQDMSELRQLVRMSLERCESHSAGAEAMRKAKFLLEQAASRMTRTGDLN